MSNITFEEMITKADTYIKLEEYDRAYNIYNEIIECYPNDYRGWWNLFKLDFILYESNLTDYSCLIANEKYASNAFKLCGDKIEELRDEYKFILGEYIYNLDNCTYSTYYIYKIMDSFFQCIYGSEIFSKDGYYSEYSRYPQFFEKVIKQITGEDDGAKIFIGFKGISHHITNYLVKGFLGAFLAGEYTSHRINDYEACGYCIYDNVDGPGHASVVDVSSSANNSSFVHGDLVFLGEKFAFLCHGEENPYISGTFYTHSMIEYENAFDTDAYLEKCSEEKELKEKQKKYWISKERCSYCGNSFNLFKKCKACGRKKDY